MSQRKEFDQWYEIFWHINQRWPIGWETWQAAQAKQAEEIERLNKRIAELENMLHPIANSHTDNEAPAVQSEPFCFIDPNLIDCLDDGYWAWVNKESYANHTRPLYTTPQPRIPAECIAEIEALSGKDGDIDHRTVNGVIVEVLAILEKYNK